MKQAKDKTVDEYIRSFPKSTQKILQEIRKALNAAVPGSEERISYHIPTIYKNGNIVHYAAFEKHIGFYPTPQAMIKFKKEIKPYRTGKGSIQFPINEPMPMELMIKIAKYRDKENQKKS
jgi:uncharacterized protein YdhG (YjbR/CyaY superfamily)